MVALVVQGVKKNNIRNGKQLCLAGCGRQFVRAHFTFVRLLASFTSHCSEALAVMWCAAAVVAGVTGDSVAATTIVNKHSKLCKIQFQRSGLENRNGTHSVLFLAIAIDSVSFGLIYKFFLDARETENVTKTFYKLRFNTILFIDDEQSK